MNEDRARNRCDNGPQNLAILKHMAINKLNAEPSKLPIRRKLKKADRADAFLRSLLAMGNAIALTPARTPLAPGRDMVHIGAGRLAKDVPLANRVRSGRKQP